MTDIYPANAVAPLLLNESLIDLLRKLRAPNSQSARSRHQPRPIGQWNCEPVDNPTILAPRERP